MATVPHPGPPQESKGSSDCRPRSAPDYHLVLRVGEKRYRFVEKVHRSKMSQIWRAVELGSGANLAVKIVDRKSAATTDRAALAALAECSASPHLVKCLRHCIKGDHWYQLLEWLDGETLSARLRRDNRRTPMRMLERWLRQIGTGLSTLHGAGIVHGDVKPDNIFIVDEQARLIDLSGQRLGAAPRFKVALTPSFACQDAMRGAPADASDDVYSYALTALCVLSKRITPPREGFKLDRAPPGSVNETQWKALRIALEPARADRTISIDELATAIWTPPRLVVPALIELPRTPRAAPAAQPLPARRDRRALRRIARRMRRTGNYAIVASTGVAMLVFALVTPPSVTDVDLGQLPLAEAPGATAEETSAPATDTPDAASADGRSWTDAAEIEAANAGRSSQAAELRTLPEALIVLTGVTTAQAEPAAENAAPLAAQKPASDGRASGSAAEEPSAVQEPEAYAASDADEPATTDPAAVGALTTLEANTQEGDLIVGRDSEPTAANVVRTALGGSTALSAPSTTPAFWTTDVPSLPDLPTIPDGPAIPDVPVTPDAPPVTPDVPMPDVPVTPATPPVTGGPDRPAVPDVPTRPEVVDRPDVRPGRPDVPSAPPDVAQGRPDVPSSRPDLPRGRPDVPAARPEIAAARPDVPQGRPDVPQGRPDVPQVRPDVPAARPEMPAARPDVPRGRPDVPPGRPDIPRGRPG